MPLAMVTGMGASSSRDAAAVAIDDDEDGRYESGAHTAIKNGFVLSRTGFGKTIGGCFTLSSVVFGRVVFRVLFC